MFSVHVGTEGSRVGTCTSGESSGVFLMSC